jgi:predicted alpha/beta superfamily hydrolase
MAEAARFANMLFEAVSRRDVASAAALIAALAMIPPASAEEAPAYAAPRSAVHEVSTKDGDRAYRLYVMTPPGYASAENAARRYPVIYLNDGELFFLTGAGAPLLSYYNKVLEETILVGISYAAGEDPIASRQRDLTPVKEESLANETGGADAYLAFIRDAVLPSIEARYRADPARRTLAGHSFGGAFATYVLLTEPALFANYIIVSPAYWYAGHALAGFEQRYAEAQSDLPARVYMAAGDLEGPKGGLKTIDLANDMSAFAARLRSRGYKSLDLKAEILGGGVTHATSLQAAWLRAHGWLFPAR